MIRRALRIIAGLQRTDEKNDGNLQHVIDIQHKIFPSLPMDDLYLSI